MMNEQIVKTLFFLLIAAACSAQNVHFQAQQVWVNGTEHYEVQMGVWMLGDSFVVGQVSEAGVNPLITQGGTEWEMLNDSTIVGRWDVCLECEVTYMRRRGEERVTFKNSKVEMDIFSRTHLYQPKLWK